MNKPTASKEFILTKAQNFILAGMGLGVWPTKITVDCFSETRYNRPTATN
jgi:hypothetical protein